MSFGDVERTLEVFRERLLTSLRYVSLLGTSLLAASLIDERSRDRNVWALLFELGLFSCGALALFLVRNRGPRVGGLVVVSTFLPAALAALFQFGPLMGTGVMFVLWVLFAAFFLDSVVIPALLMPVVLLASGWFIETGRVAVPWPQINGGYAGWIRMVGTTSAVATILGATFRHLLRSLVRASREAASARAAHDREVSERAARQRLELLGRLSGGVAHDFNNLLMVITADLDALRSAQHDEVRTKLLDDLDAAAATARATTRQLLSLSRQGHAPGGTAEPAAVLPLFATTLQRIFPESIRVEAERAQTPAVALSAGALEQALLNLCLHARDAMPRGGTLHLRAKSDGGFVRLEVEGVAAEPHAVDVTTAMGLSLVTDAMNACGGRLEVRSDATARATMTLVIPAADAAPAPKTEGARTAKKAKILLLEDDAAVQRAFVLTLKSSGHEITTASTVKEAEAACSDAARYDLFISDAVLPDGNPGALIQELRARFPELPILVCSGHLLDDVMIDGVEKDRFVFMQKPVSPVELRRVVAGLVSR